MEMLQKIVEWFCMGAWAYWGLRFGMWAVPLNIAVNSNQKIRLVTEREEVRK